jgi:hypothetical protein
LALLFLLLASARQSHPQSQSPTPAARVPTVVLLTSNLSWDDLRADGPLNDLRQIAAGGSVALLNTAVSGEATEAAAFLSIGSGERMAAPGKRGPKLLVGGVSLTVADIAAEVYPAIGPEGSVARPVYFRRFGMAPPSARSESRSACRLWSGFSPAFRVSLCRDRWARRCAGAGAACLSSVTGALSLSAWTGRGPSMADP